MFCTRCGKDIKEGNSFCEECGAPASRSETAGKSTVDIVPLAPVAAVSPTAPMPAVADAADAGKTAAMTQDRAGAGASAFCTGCGAPLKGDTAFCTRCGKPVGGASAASPQRVAAAAPAAAHPKQAGQPRQGGQEKSNKGLIIGLIAAGVVLLAAAGVVLFLLLGPSAGSSEQVVEEVPATAEDASRDESSADEENATDPAELEAGDAEVAAPESADAEAASGETPAPEPEPAPAAEPAASEYILPDSDTHAYTTSELSALSDWELFVARNEIFARHGRGFLNQELAQYFGEKSWYAQRYSPEEFDAMPSPLSAVEKQNTETMLALEQSRGSQYL